MKSQAESERSILRTNLIMTDRPDSAQLVDLHVYIIPKNVWKNHQNSAENEAMEQAISAGFVRVPENLTLHDLRRYIINICGEDDDFPKEFTYLRSVGRCLTKVKHQQENELKVKNYRPPKIFAPEIYILEERYDDDDPSISGGKTDYLVREPPISQPSMNSQSLIKPIEGPSLSYPLFNYNYKQQNSTFIPLYSNHPAFFAKLNPRELIKLREEQERLYLRQLELARKRDEIEDQQKKEEQAATKIQTAYRNYRDRMNAKQQEADAIEIERLQKVEERQARDVVKLSKRLEELRAKRIELENNRELIIRRMQQLQTQINSQRREEKNLWKQKYFMEKNQITEKEEQNRMKNPADILTKLDQAKNRLNNTTKLRQQAENESRLLRQELQQISSNLNALDRHRLPKESYHQQQQTEPISLDITLQY